MKNEMLLSDKSKVKVLVVCVFSQLCIDRIQK